MDLEIKRRNLRLAILLSGVFLPFLLLPWADPKTGGPLIPVSYCICVVGLKVSKFVYELTKIDLLRRATFIVAHVSFYIVLAWISARLIYPNKKLSPESDKTSEPIQD